MIFDVSAFFAFIAALLMGILFYLERLNGKIVHVANLCSLAAVALSFVFIGIALAHGADGRQLEVTTRSILLLNLYASLFNFAARIWADLKQILVGSRGVAVQAEGNYTDS
jgi:amino acid permease